MKYFLLVINCLLVIVHLLKIVKLYYNPIILSATIFDSNPGKGHLTIYYLIAILFLVMFAMQQFDYAISFRVAR